MIELANVIKITDTKRTVPSFELNKNVQVKNVHGEDYVVDLHGGSIKVSQLNECGIEFIIPDLTENTHENSEFIIDPFDTY